MNQSTNDFVSRLKAIIDTAIDGIITIDKKGIVEDLNPAAARLFGYLPEEIIGQNIKMLMPEPYHSKHDGYIHQYNETRKPRIIGIGREVKGKRKDGSIFPFRLAVSEVVLNDRIVFTGIVHDLSDVHEARNEILELNTALEEKVTTRTYELEEVVNKLLKTNSELENQIIERKNVEDKLMYREKELRKSLEKEKELGELKSRFVSMASHEFRTPLATILSSAALISKYTESEHQTNRSKHVERIKSSVANLTGILNDFLSLSKLEEGKVNLQFSPLHITSLCETIINDVEGLLKNNQKIIHKIHGQESETLTDARILKNILFNLISNAIKYSEKDIKCDIHFRENHFTIDIQDQGIGIPEDEQKYLFDRFFRAGNVINIQGTGLGLNIVKRYVTLLEGEISFVSESEKGSTFSVKIPYKN